jgi:hypothetical protein
MKLSDPRLIRLAEALETVNPKAVRRYLRVIEVLKLNIILIYKLSPKSLYRVLAGGGFEPPISGL